jgi:hypothetical protein
MHVASPRMRGEGHGLRDRRGDGRVAAHGAGGAHLEPPLGAARVEAVPAPGTAPQRVAARELAEADGARAAAVAAIVTGADDVRVLGVQRVDGGDVEPGTAAAAAGDGAAGAARSVAACAAPALVRTQR